MEGSNKKSLRESIQHLSKEDQAKELQSAISGNQLGRMNDRRRKSIESTRRLIHKRFGTKN